MRRIATEPDTYSLVNSIVPNYLAALQSSLLPTNTSPGNAPHNCRAVWGAILNLRGAILCILTSLPCPRMPLSMWKRKHPAFSLRCVRNLWLCSHYVSPCTPVWHSLSIWKLMGHFRRITKSQPETRWTTSKWINSNISTEDKTHQDTDLPWATPGFGAMIWLLDFSSQLLQVFTNFPLCLCCFL